MEFTRKKIIMNQKILKFFASGAFISYLPTAILKNKKNTGAGLLGSLEAFLIYLFLGQLSLWAYLFLLVGIILFAVYISQKVEFSGIEDDPKIIIDEIAGFFTTMAFLPYSFTNAILGLILFRIFDTTKILFIKRAENFALNFSQETRKKYCLKGVQIVLDDVLAGLVSNLILWFLIFCKIL